MLIEIESRKGQQWSLRYSTASTAEMNSRPGTSTSSALRCTTLFFTRYIASHKLHTMTRLSVQDGLTSQDTSTT